MNTIKKLCCWIGLYSYNKRPVYATSIMRNAIIEGYQPGTLIHIHENDRVLYSCSEFIGVTIIFSANAKKAFNSCVLRDCEIIAENHKNSLDDARLVLPGNNLIIGGSFNGRNIDTLAIN